MKRLAAIVAIMALVSGCGSSPASSNPTPSPPVPKVVSGRPALPSCGTEHATTQTGPWNEKARRCFWDAYQKAQPAEFVTTRLTTEGDPVTTIYRVLGPGRVEVFVDGTQDKFSATRAWIRLDCQTLASASTLATSPDFGPDESCVQTSIS
jgi:hypothetical protein